MKVKVREHVGVFHEALEESNLSDRKKAVMGVVLDEAIRWGVYRRGKVRFNANQQYIEEQTGIPQQTVSYTLKSLIKGGWLLRRGKYVPPRNGRPGKSYTYELPTRVPEIGTSYVHRGSKVTPLWDYLVPTLKRVPTPTRAPKLQRRLEKRKNTSTLQPSVCRMGVR
jgi:predicted transcriptional regulator